MANANNTSLPNETWKPVVGWERYYEVSDHGRVRSLDRKSLGPYGSTRTIKGRILKPTPAHSGHLYISLCREGTKIKCFVHTLVLEAFVGPQPEGLECCHNDGDPARNTVDNLRWDDRSANVVDMVEAGNHNNARKTHCKRGHEFTPENTRVEVRPTTTVRICRTCSRERDQSYRRRKIA